MKNKILYSRVLLLALLFLAIIISCNNNRLKKNYANHAESKPISKIIIKPPAAYTDTLVITRPAAVFFHPDASQLLKIKEQTDSVVYDGTMHEFFYQMRNARMVIRKTWPTLAIIESENYRFLIFIKDDNTRDCIDLDKKNDAYGLFIFNRKKPPLYVDMMNVETAISFYLKN